MICNAQLSGAMVISGETWSTWNPRQLWDARKQTKLWFYLCDKAATVYRDFADLPPMSFDNLASK